MCLRVLMEDVGSVGNLQETGDTALLFAPVI